GAVHPPQARARAGGGTNPARHFAVFPVPPVDLHPAARTERPAMMQEPVSRTRVLDAAGPIDHDHLPVTGDPERADFGVLELLAGHRLDRVAPEFRDPHRVHGRVPPRSGAPNRTGRRPRFQAAAFAATRWS